MICLKDDPALNDENCGTESEKPREHVICLWCEEPILPSEQPVPLNNETAWMHLECMVRSVVGSVGHQMHQCSCYQKIDSSEDGISMREAARRASAYWRKLNPQLP